MISLTTSLKSGGLNNIPVDEDELLVNLLCVPVESNFLLVRFLDFPFCFSFQPNANQPNKNRQQ